jgi:diguanylate cyclase (GGDEF)-like protein
MHNAASADSHPETLAREARFLGKRMLTHELLQIFAGETTGDSQQRQRLEQIKRKLGGAIYTEAVYSLTHLLVTDRRRARAIFEQILAHRSRLADSLHRAVSVQVAALDYLQDIRGILKAPTIIESEKCDDFARRATMDEISQAYDKHVLDSDLDAEIERARRLGHPLSLLFIDIDNLKKINDSRGHAAGTEAIKFVSASISRNLRKYDAVYRYGGDEFIALMSKTERGNALRVARRILHTLTGERPVSLPVRPGVSIGIATFENQAITSKQALLAAADTALYRAKESGKNTVCLFEPSPAGTSAARCSPRPDSA